MGDYFRQSETTRGNASTYLIKKALLRASENAIGRRSVSENLSWILQLATNVKRHIHDGNTHLGYIIYIYICEYVCVNECMCACVCILNVVSCLFFIFLDITIVVTMFDHSGKYPADTPVNIPVPPPDSLLRARTLPASITTPGPNLRAAL